MQLFICTVYFLNQAGRIGNEMTGVFKDPDPGCNNRCSSECRRDPKDCQDLAKGMGLQCALMVVPKYKVTFNGDQVLLQGRNPGVAFEMEYNAELARLKQDLGGMEVQAAAPNVTHENYLAEGVWGEAQVLTRENLAQKLLEIPHLSFVHGEQTLYADRDPAAFEAFLDHLINT